MPRYCREVDGQSTEVSLDEASQDGCEGFSTTVCQPLLGGALPIACGSEPPLAECTAITVCPDDNDISGASAADQTDDSSFPALQPAATSRQSLRAWVSYWPSQILHFPNYRGGPLPRGRLTWNPGSTTTARRCLLIVLRDSPVRRAGRMIAAFSIADYRKAIVVAVCFQDTDVADQAGSGQTKSGRSPS